MSSSAHPTLINLVSIEGGNCFLSKIQNGPIARLIIYLFIQFIFLLNSDDISLRLGEKFIISKRGVWLQNKVNKVNKVANLFWSV